MAQVSTMLKHDTSPEGEVITWSSYNTRLMSDDSVKPEDNLKTLTQLDWGWPDPYSKAGLEHWVPQEF